MVNTLAFGARGTAAPPGVPRGSRAIEPENSVAHREVSLPEGAVADHRHPVRQTAGDQRMLDPALLQVVTDLVARQHPRSRRRHRPVQLLGVEIGDAEASNLAGRHQLREGTKCLVERVRARAMQEVQVEMVRRQPGQAGFARPKGPPIGGGPDCAGTPRLRPAMAVPTSSSTAPAPYISAVSICVRPRSRPRRSDRDGRAHVHLHVPWPMSEGDTTDHARCEGGDRSPARYNRARV